MSIYHIIIFALFILVAIMFTLFLTHLHKRFFNYSKVSEIIIHIIRSYLLFASLTLVGIYLLFKQVSLKLYIFCVGILLCLNLISAITFYFLQKRRKEIPGTNFPLIKESENKFNDSEVEYKLSEETKVEIIEVLKKADILK